MLAMRQGARVIIVDKDFGLAPMVNANGGAYLVLANGEPTGLAPLRALTNSPQHVAYLTRLIRMMIMSDGQGDISNEEDERLQRAMELQMSMPPEMRALAGIAVALGQKDRDGARARLRKWCWGERLGWVLDCREDLLDTSRQMMGYDTTSLVKNEEVCSPVLNYIFQRTQALIDGTPIVFVIDEMWAVDKNAAFSADNNDKLTTIRKNEGAVILATQSARTALTSPNAHTFKQQIPTKIFFADDTATRDDLIDGFGLTEAEYHAVKVTLGTRRHQFLIKRPGGSVICRFDLSKRPDQIAVISGRRSTYDLMDELKAKHGQRPENWVPEFEKLAPGRVDKPVARKPNLEVVA
jgi:type IV secretion system protein VirB4